MLNIQTFDARQGGNILYKALSHPLAVEGVQKVYDACRRKDQLAVVDPDRTADLLRTLNPDMPPVGSVFVQDAREIGETRLGLRTQALAALAAGNPAAVLIAAFNSQRLRNRLQALLPDALIVTLDDAGLPEHLLTDRRTYLNKLNFATNHVFFRDAGGMSTRLVSANYWHGYGAARVRLWLRLFGQNGAVLADWEHALPDHGGVFALDSGEIRARFGLDEFTGQLFLHVIGAAGHDVVKYALDTYDSVGGPSLSCTHDANAWPSDRFAGLPAPREDERVILWLQNSHAAPIPAGAVSLDQMGAEQPVPVPIPVPGFATVAVDTGDYLPHLRWPAQIEVRAGRHVVRPRYEIVRNGRSRIAHVNVERADLAPDPAIRDLPPELGRGFLLPFPIMPRRDFRTIAQPNPMAERQDTLPLRLDVFDAAGRKAGERFLGCLPRRFDFEIVLDEFDVEQGHGELVYDFRDGGEADGWMHTLVRYEHRQSGHAAETSFGAHIYNTMMTWRDEPQSYSGPPPGLTTRLFLRLGGDLGGVARRAFTHLIYAASAPWHAASYTVLQLHDETGQRVAEQRLSIACSGSALVFPDEIFTAPDMQRAGPRGFVLIRDATCRLFGYHGLMDDRGGFSLDHMFGF